MAILNVGDGFSYYEDVMLKIRESEVNSNTNSYRRDRRTINSPRKRGITHEFKEELRFYAMTMFIHVINVCESISQCLGIFSDKFFAFVVKQIKATEWKLFFVQLGFDTNDCDHWEHDTHLVLEEAITTGLNKWKVAPLKENTACDKNIEELKAWIFTALSECERNDLVDPLKSCNQANLNLAKESDTYSLRDYQQELEELALTGRSTIICAGTNSGKTFIALHIIEKHLKKNSKGTIAFLTRTNVLLDQQFELACKLLPRLNCNGKIRKWQADQECTSENFKNLVKTSSIIFLTPQSMCNFLDEESENSRVEMNQFTLLVLDECHHTYGKTPYNDIMRHYRKLKYGENPTPRPQILGLTASPGTNKAKDVSSAKDHLMLIMANLDVSKLSVVQKYEASLLKHASKPEQVYIPSTKRQKDPVTDLLLKAMGDVTDMFDCRLVTTFLRDPVNKTDTLCTALDKQPADTKAVRFLQWLAETKLKVEELTTNQPTIPRLLHACLRHLEFYVECQDINSLLDIIDVRAVLHEGYMRLKEESEKATEQKEKDLVNILEEVYSGIFELGKRIERNPDIEELTKYLQEQYEELKDESRFLVFVKTRTTARALAEKMPEHFNSRYLTGSQNSKEEGGLSREEQTDIVTRFRDGKHICVVATSVAAEGLDIPKCNVVIKYRIMANEISSLQMRGRVRQKGGKDVIVGSQEEFEKEDINVERQYLMQEAIQLVLKEDITEAIMTKELNIFQTEDQERKREKLNPNQKNQGHFYVRCKKCSKKIVDGQFIRRIKNTHSIVCDKAIFSTIKRKTQKSKQIGHFTKKSDKVLGDCGHPWGTILIYEECEFVSLAQDSIQIIEEETKQPLSLRKWSEVDSKFPLDNITDKEVIKYRAQPTPSPPI